MKYEIEYEHLIDELVTNEETQWHFKRVKESANKYSLELSDEDFKGFLKLHTSDKDIDWLMLKMSAYRLSFSDVLVCYIIY
ncbi:hypothetical protein [Paenibacillus pini]|uniref:Uncharacterized protein n=1 Tax=Paenibacillus pini JCM 16418 TaxID=1236976 RepID=W7YQT6_9BACL|nr:hypothetical protein [Paenibacillus pini]GAF10917.1 hypothetical protein JCM16418_5154 [Paenibacillus pini JCM 16418]